MKQIETRKRTISAVAGTVMLMLVGLIYAWSVFKNPLSEIYNTWSESELSLVFTISMICWCFGGVLSGMLLRKITSGKVILIAAALTFAGFLVLSFLPSQKPTESLLLIYIFYSVFCGLGVGLVYNSTLMVVVNSFPEKAGTISGVMLMAYGFGGLIFGSIVNSLIDVVGLSKTFFILSIAVTAILVLAQFFLKPVSFHGDNGKVRTQAEGSTSSRIVNEFTPSKMIHKSSFWIYAANIILIASGGLLVINNAVPIASSFGAPAVLGLIVTVSNGVGRVFFGWLFDMRGRRIAMALDCSSMILAGVTLIFGALYGAPTLIIVGLVLTGLGFGGSASLTASIVNRFFGVKNYATNLSLMNFSIIPAAIIGPLGSSKLYDSANNSWISVFVMILILGASGFVTLLILNATAKLEKLE